MINGTLTSTGDIQIDGRVEGDVRSVGLVIGDKAEIHGEIFAEDVTVRGKVVGRIRARKVLLSATSHVEGDILHEAFAVEAGAFFEGNCRHSDNPLGDADARRPADRSAAASADGRRTPALFAPLQPGVATSRASDRRRRDHFGEIAAVRSMPSRGIRQFPLAIHQRKPPSVRRFPLSRRIAGQTRASISRSGPAKNVIGILDQHAFEFEDADRGVHRRHPAPRRCQVPPAIRAAQLPAASRPAPTPPPGVAQNCHLSSGMHEMDQQHAGPHAIAAGWRSPAWRGLRVRPRSLYSRSSIFSFGLPPTSCASAAAMKGSRSPSSTSCGVRLSTPVRRSFTS